MYFIDTWWNGIFYEVDRHDWNNLNITLGVHGCVAPLWINRQIYRQTERRTDRQTDKHTNSISSWISASYIKHLQKYIITHLADNQTILFLLPWRWKLNDDIEQSRLRPTCLLLTFCSFNLENSQWMRLQRVLTAGDYKIV